MQYVYAASQPHSFKGNGMSGHSFGPLKQNADIYYIDSQKGHDTFIISRKIYRTYYVLSGTGFFIINGERFPVTPGVLVEVPPKTEYSYSGKMTLLCLAAPRWFKGNDRTTRLNFDVFGEDLFSKMSVLSRWERLLTMQILGKSPLNAFVRANRWIWRQFSPGMLRVAPVISYGRALHFLVRRQPGRQHFLDTFFLRNRPALETILRLADSKKSGETLKIAVLGCSTGAEVYSIAWKLRSAKPDLCLSIQAMDISAAAVDVARKGVYPLVTAELTNKSIFERLSSAEMVKLFDQTNNSMSIKGWLKEGITWRVGDAASAAEIDRFGPQDLVVANNFLCHMDSASAESCLRNLARAVRPGGYLFATGVDLGIRTRIARELSWRPLENSLEEIHEGDPSVRNAWPWCYASLEPIDKRQSDWKLRYAQFFQTVAVEKDNGSETDNDAYGERLEIASRSSRIVR